MAAKGADKRDKSHRAASPLPHGDASPSEKGAGSDGRTASAADLLDRGCREHYDDADLYDFEYRRRRGDVQVYRDVARQLLGSGGRVLELACGSGRVTTALLRDGHAVVGLDLSQAMLRRAAGRIEQLGRAARERAWLVRGDARRFA